MKIIILGAKNYDFVNSDGERLSGTTLSKVSEENGNYEVERLNAPSFVYSQFSGPGLYELDVTLGNKGRIRIQGMKKIKDVKLQVV